MIGANKSEFLKDCKKFKEKHPKATSKELHAFIYGWYKGNACAYDDIERIIQE